MKANERRVDRLLKSVGVRLQLTREAMGLNQTEFAERANIASNTYNQFEKGQRVPSVRIALKLCIAHDLTLDWIYRDDRSNLSYELGDAIRALQEARRR